MNPNPNGRAVARLAVAVCIAVAVVACGSSKSGGPVAGAADTHCQAPDGGQIAQPVSQAVCDLQSTDGGDAVADYGPTLYNAEGDDDDCKYHVAWSSSDVQQNKDVTFTVTATEKATGQPATGANVIAEVFLNDTHPAPNSNQATQEQGGGKYAIGPVRFDAPGRWTVRFHLHEDCTDFSEESPHGHAAFYVDVP